MEKIIESLDCALIYLFNRFIHEARHNNNNNYYFSKADINNKILHQ